MNAHGIVQKLLEDGEDFARELIYAAPHRDPHIACATEYRDEQGEEGAESDWNPEVVNFLEEMEEGTLVRSTVRFLKNVGAVEPSSMPWTEGTWYSTSDTEWENGMYVVRSFFLQEYTDEEQREIYNQLMR